jgi:hypothetical protein
MKINKIMFVVDKSLIHPMYAAASMMPDRLEPAAAGAA